MLFRHMVPSWHEIQDRITRETGYQGSTLFRTHYNELVPSLSLNHAAHGQCQVRIRPG